MGKPENGRVDQKATIIVDGREVAIEGRAQPSGSDPQGRC